ncbi:MAG: RloB domain-containing protein [Spirochaetota bacterium]
MPRKHETLEPKRPVLILCSNLLEYNYFEQMRKDCRFTNVTVRRYDLSSASLENYIKEAGKLRRDGGYAAAWCVYNPYDISVGPSKGQEYEQLAKTKKVELCYNAPGIITWFLMHLEKPAQRDMSPGQILDRLAEDVPQFATASFRGLHAHLFPNKARAVLNTEAFRQEYGNNIWTGPPEQLVTQMPALLASLRRACGPCSLSTRAQL